MFPLKIIVSKFPYLVNVELSHYENSTLLQMLAGWSCASVFHVAAHRRPLPHNPSSPPQKFYFPEAERAQALHR